MTTTSPTKKQQNWLTSTAGTAMTISSSRTPPSCLGGTKNNTTMIAQAIGEIAALIAMIYVGFLAAKKDTE